MLVAIARGKEQHAERRQYVIELVQDFPFTVQAGDDAHDRARLQP
jgi:hypothetical protein